VTDELPQSSVALHGHEIGYVRAGSGPPLVLLHGMLGNAQCWGELLSKLAAEFTVIAPDLLGHGQSAKPIGDYSLGAHAGVLRDLLDAIGVRRATIVGHSLGGGIAMQFGYLFPERCERLVLVSSGGLGRELSPLLRASTLPGAGWVLPLVSSPWMCERGAALGRQLGRLGVRPSVDAAQAWRGFVTLGDADARRAFLATARAVVGPTGQTVSATDKLHLLDGVPTLFVWGAKDRLIPSWHGVLAHRALPGSRLEVFEGAGHFPHLSDPERFVAVVRDFVATTPSRSAPRRIRPWRLSRSRA
jgi:pimeloyl-ACP methyl ester carboxylesterase